LKTVNFLANDIDQTDLAVERSSTPRARENVPERSEQLTVVAISITLSEFHILV
jgi:hypothetical protein